MSPAKGHQLTSSTHEIHHKVQMVDVLERVGEANSPASGGGSRGQQIALGANVTFLALAEHAAR